MVAALYVEPNGIYAGVPGVELWDESRDARTYSGPHPVIAHPPCERWCALASLVEARYGYKRGDDGGCFAAALAAVRRFGGVLEHPAHSAAWRAFGLPLPKRGMWRGNDALGYVTEVDQANYGHRARKATWLYARAPAPPALRWDRAVGSVPIKHGETRRGGKNYMKRMPPREASATPTEFRDVLLAIARAVRQSSGDSNG